MSSMDALKATGDTIMVTGEITRVQLEKAAGYALTNDTRLANSPTSMRWYAVGARKMELIDGQFVFIDELNPDAVPTVSNPHPPVPIVMEVYSEDFGDIKRWRVLNWGLRPGMPWVYDVLSAKSFDRFIGGTFYDELDGLDETGVIENIDITPSEVTVKLVDDKVLHSYGIAKGAQLGSPAEGVATITLHDSDGRKLTFAVAGAII